MPAWAEQLLVGGLADVDEARQAVGQRGIHLLVIGAGDVSQGSGAKAVHFDGFVFEQEPGVLSGKDVGGKVISGFGLLQAALGTWREEDVEDQKEAERVVHEAIPEQGVVHPVDQDDSIGMEASGFDDTLHQAFGGFGVRLIPGDGGTADLPTGEGDEADQKGGDDGHGACGQHGASSPPAFHHGHAQNHGHADGGRGQVIVGEMIAEGQDGKQ